MFGLDKQSGTALYDLEKELTGKEAAQKAADYKKLISGRIEELKGLLRKLDDKTEFAQAETLLHGYVSLQKVLDKIKKK
jgi:hypothetical protein